MSEDTFAEVQSEGEDAKLDVAEKIPEKTGTETSPEKKQEEVIDEKQPTEKERWRWMQMRKERRELREQLATQKAEIEAIKASKQEQPKTESLPQWWINSYGDDQKSIDAFRTYQDNTKTERDRIKSEILQEIQANAQAETKGSEEAKQYIDQEIDDMHADGLNFKTNELMKFIVDYQDKYGANKLLDSQGNYDLRYALELMQKIQPPTDNNGVETKKKLAGDLLRTKGSIKDSAIPKVSRRMLRNGSWRDVEI